MWISDLLPFIVTPERVNSFPNHGFTVEQQSASGNLRYPNISANFTSWEDIYPEK